MNQASIHAANEAGPWNERLDPWLASLVSALLHLLMLLALLNADPPPMTAAQGAAAGGRTRADFIGRENPPTPVEQPVPRPPKPQLPKPVRKPRKAAPVPSAIVEQAENPLPPEADDAPEPPAPAPSPPVPSPPAPAQRYPRTWTGRPPGLIEQDVADNPAGLARNPVGTQGNRRDSTAEGNGLEVGGYLVQYDLRNETRLREWKEAGMTELFLPLPGTQSLMVCPLQVALDRDSGECRLLPPDSPELAKIGDARLVIDMLQVYRRGEPVWRGPGPYR
ncbi:MAG: type II toxin-antitoxin system RelE/ParE family toxin [Pseudoxanthomonas sp.]